MSKDRNTIAKRQRENEKKRKAVEKREKRKQRKDTPTADMPEGSFDETADESSSDFSKSELRVFDAFRKYLMTPGQMLCFNAQDIDSMRNALETLIEQGMLISEGSKGAYSLTREGFEAMKSLD